MCWHTCSMQIFFLRGVSLEISGLFPFFFKAEIGVFCTFSAGVGSAKICCDQIAGYVAIGY